MHRQQVKSSHLKSVGYDRLRKVLEVEFKNGKVYQYPDVPEGLHRDLMTAESKGAFFTQKVRTTFTGRPV